MCVSVTSEGGAHSCCAGFTGPQTAHRRPPAPCDTASASNRAGSRFWQDVPRARVFISRTQGCEGQGATANQGGGPLPSQEGSYHLLWKPNLRKARGESGIPTLLSERCAFTPCVCNVQLAIWGATGRKAAGSTGAPGRGASKEQGLLAHIWSCTQTRGLGCCRAQAGRSVRLHRVVRAPLPAPPGRKHLPLSLLLGLILFLSTAFQKPGLGRDACVRCPDRAGSPALCDGSWGPGCPPPFSAHVCGPWRSVPLDTRRLRELCSRLQGPDPHPTSHVCLQPSSTQGTRPSDGAASAEDLCLRLHLSSSVH